MIKLKYIKLNFHSTKLFLSAISPLNNKFKLCYPYLQLSQLKKSTKSIIKSKINMATINNSDKLLQSNQTKPISLAISQIKYIYEKYGAYDYIGERMTQTQHAEQCAALANKHGCDIRVIIAALLHDIGHLIGIEQGLEEMIGLGIIKHEKVGANYLRSLGMDEMVCILIENHVNVKRYLITKNPDYYNKLSNASKQTFDKYQGGKMSDDEVKDFELNPYFKEILLLRSFDDAGKVEDLEVAEFHTYMDMVEKLIK
jgi:putative nucleotidyltransferase with HDIG domain